MRGLLLLMVVCSGATLAAQQGGQAQATPGADAPGFTLKTSANRVLLDVTVTDAHGEPVHGLGKDDFLVEEDGVPQPVLSFDAYTFESGLDPVKMKLPSLPAGTFLNLSAEPERGPLYVLFYDLVNIPQGDQIFARAQLVKFIEGKPAGARFAIVVSSDGVHLVQGFTSDRSKLLAAVDPNGTGPHVPKVFLMGVNFGEGDNVATSSRLQSIARYLAPISGKKNLIWFASEFPLSLFASPEQTEQDQKEARKTLDLFAASEIAVYPMDVSGVVVADSYGAPGDTGDGVKSSVGGKASAANHGASKTFSSFMKQEEIAKTTGGKATYSNNDLVGSLEKATEVGGNYYSVSYSPTNKDFDGHLRRIQVKLKEGKYRLAYRHAYYGVSGDADG